MPFVDETRWVINPDGSRSRRLTVPTAADDDGPSATKAAVEKAEELGVDISTVEGTGKDGRITVGDVENAAD